METLSLTSPTIKGPQVKAAQEHLKKNVFNQDYLQDVIDSEFGPATMRACKRAKYWLGYKGENQQGSYGTALDAYLRGEKPLPAEQKARRKARMEKAQERPLRLRAIDAATLDIGIKEHPPGSNICEISRWYNLIGPWCAMAVTKWYIEAGSTAFKKGSQWAYVPFLLSAGVRGDYGLSITRAPKPGDIVTFDWDDDKIADHVGIVTTAVSQGNFKTIEGNTAVGNDSNGGEVMRRDRNVKDVAVTGGGHLGFIHVGR